MIGSRTKLIVLATVFSLLLTFCGGGGPDTPPDVRPTISAVANPPTINQGETSTLEITTTNASEVSVSSEGSFDSSSGYVEVKVSPLATTNYSIVASGPAGTMAVEVTVTVNIDIPGPPVPTPPAAPAGVVSEAGDSEVTVSWFPVSGADFYNIYYSTNSNITKETGTKLSDVISPFNVTQLSNGTTYYFIVTAVRTADSQDWESDDSSITSAVPGPVIIDAVVTATWILPTAYSDGTPIDPSELQNIIVTLYANTTGSPPWGNPRTVSLPGTTFVQFNMTVIQGDTYFFTGTATLNGAVSTYAIPVQHTFN